MGLWHYKSFLVCTLTVSCESLVPSRKKKSPAPASARTLKIAFSIPHQHKASQTLYVYFISYRITVAFTVKRLRELKKEMVYYGLNIQLHYPHR
ncbi:hypothetical protein V1507DRAFT_322438 [Lipomyces tetrasporus]